jgi:hypothetical protein
LKCFSLFDKFKKMTGFDPSSTSFTNEDEIDAYLYGESLGPMKERSDTLARPLRVPLTHEEPGGNVMNEPLDYESKEISFEEGKTYD